MSQSGGKFIRSIENVRSWFEHAAGRDRMSNSLTLVTGHVKSNSWAVAATSNASKSKSISLSFTLAGVGEGNISASHSWRNHALWTCNDGPRPPSDTRNQCVFMMGYRITKRHRLSPLRLLSGVRVTDLKGGTSNYPNPGTSTGGQQSSTSSGAQSSGPPDSSKVQASGTDGSSRHSRGTRQDPTSCGDPLLDEAEDDELAFEDISGKGDVSVVLCGLTLIVN
jgi:hypothetical protein